MKKKLEADLISIAHRVLQLKNKSDIHQLYLETQKLYEKLAVLKFVDDNFNALKPTIGYTEIESEIETIFKKEDEIPAKTSITEDKTEPKKTVKPQEVTASIPEPILEKIIPKTIIGPVLKKIKETEITEEFSFSTKSKTKPIPDFKPAFELNEEPKKETETNLEKKSVLFEDIIGANYADAEFVKVDNLKPNTSTSVGNEIKEKKVPKEVAFTVETKSIPLNKKLAKGFQVDLNDRIAFTKHLFANSSEDYSRVLNQLQTFDTYSEAQEFIENMVKPDYNNWDGKEDYAERFLEIIEKKFS